MKSTIPSYISSQTHWLLSERKANEYMSVLIERSKGMNTPENYRNYNKKVNACAFATLSKSKKKLAIDRRVTDQGGFTMFLGEESEEGIAVIPLVGAMLKRGNMTGDVSGVRDTRDVSAEINQALESKFVKAIVLEIDSGGGSVDGTEELAGVVANADKPVIVWGDGLIASAAYWVASQADYIMMSSATTSEVGSIGVYSIYANYSGYLEKEGVDMRILRSTGSSDKVALNPIEEPSQEAIDVEVAQMDVILGTFTKAVRGARAEKLTNAQNQDIDVFTGKVFNASEGIELGLVDSIGTLDDAIFLAVDMAADKFSDNRNKSQGTGGTRDGKTIKNNNMDILSRLGGIFKTAAKGDEAGAETEANALAQEIKRKETEIEEANAKIMQLQAQNENLSKEGEEQQKSIDSNENRLAALEKQVQVIGGQPEAETVEGNGSDDGLNTDSGNKFNSKYGTEAVKSLKVAGKKPAKKGGLTITRRR